MSKKLTNEEIIENRQTFHKICKMYNVCNDDFLLFLDSTDFYYAPLMPMKSGINVFSGGLVEYIIKVSRYILKINKIFIESALGVVLKIDFCLTLAGEYLKYIIYNSTCARRELDSLMKTDVQPSSPPVR